MRLNPQDALAHYNLGVLLETVKKDYAGAEQAYQEAVRLDPQNAPAHNFWGACCTV